MFEAREFTSTQRKQVNLLQTPRIHLLALRDGIANACPASKSDLPWQNGDVPSFTASKSLSFIIWKIEISSLPLANPRRCSR